WLWLGMDLRAARPAALIRIVVRDLSLFRAHAGPLGQLAFVKSTQAPGRDAGRGLSSGCGTPTLNPARVDPRLAMGRSGRPKALAATAASPAGVRIAAGSADLAHFPIADGRY